jgi:hypothetical protein
MPERRVRPSGLPPHGATLTLLSSVHSGSLPTSTFYLLYSAGSLSLGLGAPLGSLSLVTRLVSTRDANMRVARGGRARTAQQVALLSADCGRRTYRSASQAESHTIRF